MLSAGSSQRRADQREACAVLVPSQRTSHLAAGSASPVDMTGMRLATGGLAGIRQKQTLFILVLFIFVCLQDECK